MLRYVDFTLPLAVPIVIAVVAYTTRGMSAGLCS